MVQRCFTQKGLVTKGQDPSSTCIIGTITCAAAGRSESTVSQVMGDAAPAAMASAGSAEMCDSPREHAQQAAAGAAATVAAVAAAATAAADRLAADGGVVSS
jgi:hypothetical protein